MPHIRALFVDTPEVRGFLKAQKTEIRKIVADTIGYPPDEVAIFPESISVGDFELADNLLPLEFVINSGTRSLDKEDELAEQMKMAILAQCSGAANINFGLWLISHEKNAFVESKPS